MSKRKAGASASGAEQGHGLYDMYAHGVYHVALVVGAMPLMIILNDFWGVPFPLAVAIGLVPLLLLSIFKREKDQPRMAAPARLCGIAWYLVGAAIVAWAIIAHPDKLRVKWWIYAAFAGWGAAVCAYEAYKTIAELRRAGEPEGQVARRPGDEPPMSQEDLNALFDLLDRPDAPECDHTLRETVAFLESRGLEVDKVVAWLKEHGGFCDCEVVYNVEPEFRSQK